MVCLSENFFLADAVSVARELLGKRLVRLINNQRVAGVITETEAYRGEEDRACHARSGKTKRNAVMYGLPGKAYIYFTYGMHWCFNAVCGPQGFPAAVLVRAVQPVEGLDFIAERRQGIKPENWCNGPARLCKALGIDRDQNGNSLCKENGSILIEDAPPIEDAEVLTSPRVGIQYAPEPWRSIPWRFTVVHPRSG